MKKSKTSPSVIGGASIIATICVGAGMLGLPTAGAGGWFFWSCIILFLTMLMMTISGSMLMESLKGYKLTASYSTVTKDILGKKVAIINNLAVYFVGFIILYAYITTMGELFGSMIDIDNNFLSILCVFSLSSFVWYSTKSVDRISFLLIIFMVLSFILLSYDLFINIDFEILFDKNSSHESYFSKSWALLPVALTSFGYHHSVSTMRNYYRDEWKAMKAIVLGTLIALSFYFFWIVCVYGNLSRDSFSYIIQGGGNVDLLLSSISENIGSVNFKNISLIFSTSALMSSFIGVGLGLFDFISDCFCIKNSLKGRTKTWFLTFLPPLICSIFFPFGFVTAISYAGAVAAIWTLIIPAVLLLKIRRNSEYSEGFKAPGGTVMIGIVIIFGVLTIIAHFLNMLGVLPSFR